MYSPLPVFYQFFFISAGSMYTLFVSCVVVTLLIMIFRRLFEMIKYGLLCKIARSIVAAILKSKLEQCLHKFTLFNLSIPKSTTSTERRA